MAASLLEPHEAAFCEEVRDWCRQVAPRASATQYYEGRGGLTRELYRELGARGWLSLTWPLRSGGSGLPVSYDFLLWDELAYWRLARPDLGPGIVAHLLVEHGTPAQQARLLPGIASGEDCYCLGYSEPGAGSDLAGLQTRARRDGDSYVVAGEKCWTSDAHHARFILLLARSGAPDSRGRGLSLFVCPTDAAGITISPIPTMDGHRLNQVHFDDVCLPLEARIGAEHGAWRMIRAALAVERHLQLLPGRPRRDLEDLVSACDRLGILDDRAVSGRVAPLVTGVLEAESSALSTVRLLVAGADASLQAARSRLLGSRLVQDISRTAVELLGDEALVRGQIFELLWRQTIMETIAGGTSEILEGMIARQALGLGGTP